jgi:hypothetical protein
VQRRNHPGVEPSPYVPGREPAGVVDSEEIYSDTEEPGDDAPEVSEQHATSGTVTTS